MDFFGDSVSKLGFYASEDFDVFLVGLTVLLVLNPLLPGTSKAVLPRFNIVDLCLLIFTCFVDAIAATGSPESDEDIRLDGLGDPSFISRAFLV